MGNFLKKQCCPVDVETRKFEPCRVSRGLAPAAVFGVDDIIYLSNYEKGCVDAALRAHNEDKLIEIEESMGVIVNV
jgi:hypothetical protein